VRQTRGMWVWISALAVCVFAAASAQAQPKLRVLDEERVWDLTNEKSIGVPIGETVEHEFVLKNEGTEPLEITEASAAESFLTAELPSEPIPPGEDGQLKVAFCTEGMEPSWIETHITLRAKGVATPTILTVKAHVIPKPETLLVVMPQERSVGLVRPGNPATLRYRCENAGSTDLELKALKTRYPWIDERFEVVEDAGPTVLKPGDKKEFELKFTPRPDDAGREIDTFFTVQTDSVEQPHVVCRVRGYVAPPEEGVQIVPRFVPGAEPRYFFHIANYTEHAAEVVALRAGAEIRNVTVEPGGSTFFEENVDSADALNEISFQIKLLYASATPEGEVSEEAVDEVPIPEEATETETPAEGEATEPSVEAEGEPAESSE